MPQLPESTALAILRIVTGLLVFAHGVRKVVQGPVEAIGRQMVAQGFPASFSYVVTLGELAGLLLALGYYPRIAAAVVAGTLWGVVLWVQLGLWPAIGTGRGVPLEYPVLLAITATLLALVSSTRWSLGRGRRR
jgi:putative oxidoreductase